MEKRAAIEYRTRSVYRERPARGHRSNRRRKLEWHSATDGERWYRLYVRDIDARRWENCSPKGDPPTRDHSSSATSRSVAAAGVGGSSSRAPLGSRRKLPAAPRTFPRGHSSPFPASQRNSYDDGLNDARRIHPARSKLPRYVPRIIDFRGHQSRSVEVPGYFELPGRDYVIQRTCWKTVGPRGGTIEFIRFSCSLLYLDHQNWPR